MNTPIWKPILGIALIIICMVGTVANYFPKPEVEERVEQKIIENIEEDAQEHGVQLNEITKEYMIRQYKILYRVQLIILPFFVIPFLIIGLGLLLKGDSPLWSWRHKRINRYPVGAFFVYELLGLYGIHKYFLYKWHEPPPPDIQLNIDTPLSWEPTFYLAIFIVGVLVSLYLYIGKRASTEEDQEVKNDNDTHLEEQS